MFCRLVFLAALLVSTTAWGQAGQPATTEQPVSVVIPAGTLILTHLSAPMSSADVHTGDLFQFVVAKDVVVQNLVVIPAGTNGVGHVTEARQAGSHGKSGGIRLAFDYTFAPDGSQIPVAHNQQAEEADKSYVGGPIVALLVFWPALFFHNFVHGKDVTIPSDAVTFVTTLASKSVVVDSVKAAVPVPGPPVPLATNFPVPGALPQGTPIPAASPTPAP